MTAIKNGTLLVKDSNGNTARVATLSQTDITTLNTALADIEANKRKISSISANYVTTNTEQTISKNRSNISIEIRFHDSEYIVKRFCFADFNTHGFCVFPSARVIA